MNPVTPWLMLLLVAGVSLVARAQTEALKCSQARSSTKVNSLIFPLDQQSTRSIRFTAPSGNVKWDALLVFGEEHGGSFTTLLNLEIKKNSGTAHFQQLRLYEKQISQMIFMQRVSTSWLNNGGQATLYIGELTFSIILQRPNAKHRKLLMELTDPRITGINAVKVIGDLKVEECEGPERIPETTTTTTAPTTTTTEPTTTITTPTTTTTTPVTTTPSSTTPTEVLTTSQDDATTTITTAKEDDSPRNCLPTEDSKADPTATINCTSEATETVTMLGNEWECQLVLKVAWACGGLALVFLAFIVMLITYSIVLYKRSWTKSEESLRANNSGGFGMSANDMCYYEMKDANLMIGNTVPRIKTPRPSSCNPELSPSSSTYRLSSNFPRTPSPSRNTLHFPVTELGESMSDIPAHQDKSRNSKVSFVDI